MKKFLFFVLLSLGVCPDLSAGVVVDDPIEDKTGNNGNSGRPRTMPPAVLTSVQDDIVSIDENENEMSDLARANVKALAGIEIPGDDTEKKRLRIIPCSHSPHNRCDYSSIDIFYECQVISFC